MARVFDFEKAKLRKESASLVEQPAATEIEIPAAIRNTLDAQRVETQRQLLRVAQTLITSEDVPTSLQESQADTAPPRDDAAPHGSL